MFAGGATSCQGMPRANFLWMQGTRDRMLPDGLSLLSLRLASSSRFYPRRNTAGNITLSHEGAGHHWRSLDLAGARALDPNDQDSQKNSFPFLAPGVPIPGSNKKSLRSWYPCLSIVPQSIFRPPQPPCDTSSRKNKFLPLRARERSEPPLRSAAIIVDSIQRSDH